MYMRNAIRDIFDMSPEAEIERLENILAIVLDGNITSYKNMRIVKHEDWLYKSDPLKGFIGDCDSCVHVYNNHQGLSDGWFCGLHGVGCGYGFVCKEYKGPYPTDFENPYVSILENERKWVKENIDTVRKIRWEN